MVYIFLSFVVTFIMIYVLIPLANKINLLDVPNHRKIHSGSVPLIGGIAIYTSTLILTLGYMAFEKSILSYFGGATLVFLVSIVDDLNDLRVRYRLVAQIVAPFIFIAISGVYFDYLGTFPIVGTINASFLGVGITVLFFITNVNSYNMVDGIDGLLGMLALISITTLSIFFYLADSPFFKFSNFLAASIFCYLLFNFKKPAFLPKVFIGDSGAMFIGFTISWLCLIATTSEGAIRPVIILYIVAVPLMDLLFNVFNRIRKGQSPIRPQRDHIHHRLISRGLSDVQTVVVISIFAVFISALGILGNKLVINDFNMLLGFIFIFIMFTYYFIHTSKFLRE